MIPPVSAQRGGIRYPKPGDPPLPRRQPLPVPEEYTDLMVHLASIRELRYVVGSPITGYTLADLMYAVVELHRPTDPGYGADMVCSGCDRAGFGGDAPPWPCSTIEIIQDLLGLRVSPPPHSKACVDYGDESRCDACNGE